MSVGLRIFMAMEVTLCYIPGLFLRIFPFASQLSFKQKKTLVIDYSVLMY